MSEWLDIPDLPGFCASDEGQILDLNKGRVRSQRRAGNGAMQVDINDVTHMVHTLVARAFHGTPPAEGYRVKHRNGDRADNRPLNLVWAGAPRTVIEDSQSPAHCLSLEQEYESLRLQRYELIELMQT